MRVLGSLSHGLLYITLFHLHSTNGFSDTLRKLKAHEAEHNAVFHSNLLKQLADSRLNSSDTHSNPLPNLATVDAVVPNSVLVSTFATDSTESLQIYTQDSLPTNPAPPAACASALTAAIACNSTIPLMAVSPYMFIDELNLVCTNDCTVGLESYRAGVISACGSYTITDSTNNSFAPTLALDYVSGPYAVQCLRDPSSGQFCGPVVQSLNTTNGLLSLPTNELCTYCVLETLNATLSNPTSYSFDVADILSDAIDICGPNYEQYNVTFNPGDQVVISAPPFGVNGTTAPTIDCALNGRNITTSSNTTCASVAAQNSVSEYDIFSSNPFLNADCTIAAGTNLCVPQSCTTYSIAVNDTCLSVAAQAGKVPGTDMNITAAQIQSFNPDLGTYCQLMPLRVGKTICLTPNGGWPSVGATSAGNPSATPTTVAAVPTPITNGTNTSACGRYYEVQVGDICQTVALNNGITLADFQLLNPQIDANCTNLWLNYYYCVAAYPALSTVTSMPIITTNFTSATVFSYPISTANYTMTYATSTITAAGVSAPTNIADGTRPVACGSYYDVQTGDTLDSVSNLVGVNATDLVNWNPEISTGSLPAVGSAICILFPLGNYTLPPAPRPTNAYANATLACAQYYTIVSGDGCSSVEAKFGITNTQLDLLNPGLASDCTNLILGLAYCVFPTVPLSQLGGGGSPGDIPSNVAPGTITNGCTKYYTVVSGDNCAVIEADFAISSSDFLTWNPEIAKDCSNLQLGLAYCVSNAPSTIPGNVAPGTITDGCTQYYTVVSGDSCGVIESKFKVTSTQFLTWNPEISTDCTNLQLGLAYCVASSQTTTPPPSGPPSNLAAGSLSNCTAYYTVVSGDNCPAIETSFHIAAADFFRWNPEVSTACTNIQVGEAYCVGGGGNACRKIYVVKSGDSCFAITQSQGISQAQLNALNPFLDANCDLSVGENLCVG